MSYAMIGDLLNEEKYEKLLIEASLYAATLENGKGILTDEYSIHPTAQNAYDIMMAEMRKAPIEMLQVFDLMAEEKPFDGVLEMPVDTRPPEGFTLSENGRFLAECLYQTAEYPRTENSPRLMRVQPEKRAAAMQYALQQQPNGIDGKKAGFRERRAVAKAATAAFEASFGKEHLKKERASRSALEQRAAQYGEEMGMTREVKRINKLFDKTDVAMMKTGKKIAALEGRIAASHKLSAREVKSLSKLQATMAELGRSHREAMDMRAEVLENYLAREGETMELGYRGFVQSLIDQTKQPAPDAKLAVLQDREVKAPEYKNDYNIYEHDHTIISHDSRFFPGHLKAVEAFAQEMYEEEHNMRKNMSERGEARAARRLLDLKEKGVELDKGKSTRTAVSLDDTVSELGKSELGLDEKQV